jgi:hypothetical protein
LLISQAPAILSTRSALFIVSPRRSLSCPAHVGNNKLCLSLGNLTVCIFLPPSGLSTVKIRAGSLFCTVEARIGALEADFRFAVLPIPPGSPVFLRHPQPPTPLHRMYTGAAGLRLARCRVVSAKSRSRLVNAFGKGIASRRALKSRWRRGL